MAIVTETLLVHCSHHRVARASRKFVEEELQIPEYDLLSVPGGPQFLRSLEYMPKFTWAGRRWLGFLVDAHRIRRVVLVGHENCAWYRHLHGVHESHDHRLTEDLLHAAAVLREWFPGLRVEAYFATDLGGDASFLKVE